MNGINPKTVKAFLKKFSVLGASAIILGSGITEIADRASAIDPKPTTENSPLDFKDCIKCGIAYPEKARQQGIEGRVEVAFDVDNNGNPINVQLVRSSGYQELDKALIEQVPKFQLNSANAGRKNVRLSVNFKLKSPPSIPPRTKSRVNVIHQDTKGVGYG